MPERVPGYIYSAADVFLILKPEPTMTWGMWGNTLRGLRLFGEHWEFVVMNFDVLSGEEGHELGTGHLWKIS